MAEQDEREAAMHAAGVVGERAEWAFREGWDAAPKVNVHERTVNVLREDYERLKRIEAVAARSRQVVETAVAAERERVLAEIREGIEGKFLDREVGLPSLNAVRAVLDRASGNETGSGCGECWVCIDRSGIAPMGYVLCPTCGNKRCPHAADHNLECTHSNEPGQSGSARYPAPPWMVGDETGEQS